MCSPPESSLWLTVVGAGEVLLLLLLLLRACAAARKATSVGNRDKCPSARLAPGVIECTSAIAGYTCSSDHQSVTYR